MDSSKFALLISLISSISVVLISTIANIWSKWIDSEQKKQDRSLEFSKAYALRKMDAGEIAIGRNNLLISSIQNLEQLARAFVKNYGYYYDKGEKMIDNEITKANNLLMTDKSSYRLYFDTDADSEALALASNKCNFLINDVLSKLNDMRDYVDKLSDKKQILIKGDNLIKFQANQTQLDLMLSNYLIATSEYKRLLIENCKFFRNEMNKYDLHG